MFSLLLPLQADAERRHDDQTRPSGGTFWADLFHSVWDRLLGRD